ncbi:hypothetical protein CK486_13995 [Pseudomonas sp. HAR-UPW-AIA-41]|uniref:hypothetical protein n=1 Tax=Pseudomonas sp. HAR-UPW-AIA-41 TaxID=1985301 RepID=UPI000BB2FA41|nr:hypothetical protein [Pseudomonas sp. HAR-UPW-AIA-41]PAV47285.1 hypothetical protein CK486_13995 [Pseudomonas sp. HAR-UPW-AIA-41]
MPSRAKNRKPVRDVAKRVKRGHKAYVVPTPRNDAGWVAGQSFLERNHLLLLSVQVGIKRLWDQAVCIDLDNETLVDRLADLPKRGGKAVRRYTADSAYERDDGQQGVCESKPSAFLAKHGEKHALAKKILNKYGKSFTTLTEEQFTPVFISNLENLLKATSEGQRHHAELAIEKLHKALVHQQRWLTQALKQSAGLSNADIFFGLAHGVLCADLSQSLFDSNSWVEAAHGSLDHLVFVEL